MTQKRDGGPAFPVPQMVYPKDGAPHYIIDGGLSIRDWFAGQALPGIINGVCPTNTDACRRQKAQWEGVARKAGICADHMMYNREGK